MLGFVDAFQNIQDLISDANLIATGLKEPLVGIRKNESQVEKLRIYPNPASESIRVSFTSDKADLQTYISITDILGRKVYYINKIMLNQGKNELLIEADEFGAGIYVLKLLIGESTFTKKFAVIK